VKHLTEDQIQEYLDNSITTGKQEIAAHLDSCQMCQNRVKEYKALFLQLKAAEPEMLSADFTSKVMVNIEAEVPPVESSSVWAIVFSVLGAILGLVSIGYFVNFKPLLEMFKISDAEQYFNRILFDELNGIAGYLNIDIGTVLYVGLALIIIAAIDYIIRHHGRRPVSFLM